MKPLAPVLALALAGALAPMQCSREPNPSLARDETPGEALLSLADRLRDEGDSAGETRALQFLVERYALSRQAEEARVRLRERGASIPSPRDVGTSASSANIEPSSAAK